MEPRIQYAQTSDGLSIAYFTNGEGPAIVWMPSPPFQHIGEDLRMGGQRRLIVDRSGSARLVTYDARGTGLSDRETSNLSLEAYERDLEAVTSAIGIEKYALVAPSNSGPVAIWHAARRPEKVTHLCLVWPYQRGADVYSSSYAQSLKALRAQDWMIYTETSARVLTGWTDDEGARRLASYMRLSVTQEDAMATWAAVEAFDVQDLLPKVTVPTIVIGGEGPWIPLELSRRVAAAIDQADFVVLEQVVLASVPNVIAPIVERFVLGTDEWSDDTSPEDTAPTLRTVLFTDLVGHAEMMSRLGDERGRTVLREHERITREVLKRHGGTEVKTMGDGFMASFGSVTKAVECAVALQRAFADREGEPLSVRVGLNAGEPIEDDGDLFGATVILASRIAAKAGGGEILVADTVRGLCSGKGFLFADRGEFVAKGFEEPVRVYEVSWRA